MYAVVRSYSGSGVKEHQRFLFALPAPLSGGGAESSAAALANVVLVQNFFEELRQVVPD